MQAYAVNGTQANLPGGQRWIEGALRAGWNRRTLCRKRLRLCATDGWLLFTPGTANQDKVAALPLQLDVLALPLERALARTSYPHTNLTQHSWFSALAQK